MTRNRKRFWVDPPLQVQMMAVVMSLVLCSLVLVAFSVLHGLREASAESQQAFHTLDWFSQAVRGPLILSASISLLSSALIILAWSHRFAGPLRVLSAGMQRLKQGNFSVPVRIRRMDTHQDLVGEFAAMQGALRNMLEADRKAAADAAQQLRRIAATLPQAEAASLEKTAASLKRLSSNYQI
jgi:nitrogen fixation/metabolism regulation signal transduction histidine kinase